MPNFPTLAVIGDPIEKSLSPTIQNAMLNYLNIQEEYTKFQVSPSSLDSWIKSEAIKLKGFNVTMPLKQEIISFLTEISEEARQINAVNTVVCKNNKLYGYNTDGIGFMRALATKRKDLSSLKIAMIGAGGAACALAQVLVSSCAELSIYCRKAGQVKFAEKIKIHAFEDLFKDNSLQDIDILINTTPLGMYGYNSFENLNFIKYLKKKPLVCDLIYKPEETLLLKEARMHDFETMNGLGMLIHQAIAALELFLDKELDKNKMEEIAKNAINSIL